MDCNGWVWVWAALLLLVLPLPWLGAAVLAAAVHELCHLGAVYALGGRVSGLRLGLLGARLTAGLLPGTLRPVLAILAGPVGSLCLVLLAPRTPRLSLCALIQGLYNLLPLSSLDGGRALALCLEHWCPRRAVFLCAALAHAALLSMALLSLWTRSLLPLLAAGLAFYQDKRIRRLPFR